ncbi:MAG: LysM peptidoglycan-binding domain-containing protein [Burkholderiales bacterium]|nr:LysM peptidoglycan-binding domain-containing protein [Burkholderiales bacterium]
MRKSFIIGLVLLLAHGSAWAAAPAALDPNAPERYVVVPGDTLWGISGRFLKDPWRWPQLFELNKDQIKNPHRIYPGDVIVLDRATGRAQVVSGPTVTLTPRIRVEPRDADAIPSIPADAIEPFLTQPLVIDQQTLDQAPRIVATEENRMVVGAGNKAYARGIDGKAAEFWQVFRPGEPLIDPDSREPLGFQAVYLGDARVVRPGEVSIVEIVRSNQEMYIGDRMFAAPKPQFTSYVPRAPEKSIQGKIISAYGGLAEVGRNSVVTLNRGSRDGLEVGNVLAVFRSPESASNIRPHTEPISGFRNTPLYGRTGPTGRNSGISPPIPETDLPPERHGLLFVFRTFERVSYALVMQSNAPIHVFDRVQNP